MFQRKPTHRSHPLGMVVETDDPLLEISDFVAYSDAGFDVVTCSGPSEGHPCPALAGQQCELAANADVVLSAFCDPAKRNEVATAVRSTTPDVPIVVTMEPDSVIDLPERCVRLSTGTSIGGQIDVLRRSALGH